MILSITSQNVKTNWKTIHLNTRNVFIPNFFRLGILFSQKSKDAKLS